MSLTLSVGAWTRTVTQWSREIGLPDTTIRDRKRRGWSDTEALGLAPQPARDRAAEQQAHADATTELLIVDQDGSIISRREAARRLVCSIATLRNKLHKYRLPDAGCGVPARVPLSFLVEEIIKTRARRG